MIPRSRARRSGFALVAVLWLITAAAALGLTASLAARGLVASARNRMDATRAFWLAEDCLERTRAVIAEALRDDERRVSSPAGASPWTRMDATVLDHFLLAAPECRVTIEPAGARLDVNAASETALSRLIHAAGLEQARADSLAAAIADWRDADTMPRPLGAERGTYVAEGRAPPRNAPFADVRELQRVRGWDATAGLDALLTVEPDPICLQHAPAAVLGALAGFTPELVTLIVEERRAGRPIGDVAEFLGRLSEPARAALVGRLTEAPGAVVTEPRAWIVTSRGWSGDPPLVVVLEARLVRDGARPAMVRKRSWLP